MLYSRAGVINVDYEAQKLVLGALDGDDRRGAELAAAAAELRDAELEKLLAEERSGETAIVGSADDRPQSPRLHSILTICKLRVDRGS